MSNHVYAVYDKTQPGGGVDITARISFDIVGAFSNQPFHCEATGQDILAIYAGSGSRWKPRSPGDASASSGYTTSFKFSPGDWNALTLREMSLCGTDPHAIRTVLFKGAATSNYFRSDEGSRPDPPSGGSNVQTWTRTYYNSAHIQAQFTLIPPPSPTNCTSGNTARL